LPVAPERPARKGVFTISAAIVLVLLIVGGVMAVVTNYDGQWEESPYLLSMLAFGLLGALVLWRRPGNAMGWVFSAMGLSGTLAAAAPQTGAGSVLGGLGWFTFFFLTFAVLPMLYPTGETLSRRWRWVLLASISAYACFAFLWIFQETLCLGIDVVDGEEVCIESMPNPIGVDGIENPEYSGPGSILLVSFLIAGVIGLVSLAIRYRRARGIERQQLKWLLLSLAALMSFVFLIDIILAEWFGFRLPDPLYNAITAVLWLGLPTTAGLAIFRYGLYDIDRVISRTVAYGLVVATLTIAYVAVVAGVGAFVSIFSPSDVEVPMPVIATALVAIAFHPVRQRAIGVADRMVFGRRRTPYEALAGVGGAHLDDLLPQIARLATESTAARGAIVWLSDGVELQPAAVFPESGTPPEPVPLDDGQLPTMPDVGETLALTHQDSLLGAISIVTGAGEDLSPDDRRLLTDLVAHAALTLHGVLESAPLPEGIVTFLMTDIEGSTRLWEDDAETMAVALRAHDAMARRIVGDGGGVLVKWRGEGDSTFSVFTNAGQAVETAITLQEEIRAQDWGTARPISIRAALHTGVAELRERDYFGQTVNRCARIRSLAKGGQTLVSAATRELAREGLSKELRFTDLGEYQLKDLSDPEQVYEVVGTTATDVSTKMPAEPAV
jgi:class 3 adenylate cyclase/MFS family permease